MAARYPDVVAAGQLIASAWGNDVHDGFAAEPLFQWGLFNGNTDANGYARPTWPIAYPGIPASGDAGNGNTVGILCIQARGAGTVLQVPHMMYSLGGFNAGSAIVRCFQIFNNVATPVTSTFCPFHFLVWGPRFTGQISAGTRT
jgi:hypothetical protein